MSAVSCDEGMTGQSPRRLALPVWLFERFVGTDETTMWRGLRGNEIDPGPGPTRAIHPHALTVRAWLERKRARAVRRLTRPDRGAAA